MKPNYLTYIIIIFTVIMLFTGCYKDDSDNTSVNTINNFTESINIDTQSAEYKIGDTIWFFTEFPDNTTDYYTGEKINFTNATYILNGSINLLMPTYDTIPFIEQNFNFVKDTGDLMLINIINSNQVYYYFDVKFGKPANNNKVRFGIIPEFPGIFAVEYKGNVYFGENRTNYNDFSTNNKKGYFELYFNTKSVNDSLFYNLPEEYYNKYSYYYQKNLINQKKFYFFKINER